MADQLQTNYAGDLRHILKPVFDCYTSETAPSPEPAEEVNPDDEDDDESDDSPDTSCMLGEDEEDNGDEDGDATRGSSVMGMRANHSRSSTG